VPRNEVNASVFPAFYDAVPILLSFYDAVPILLSYDVNIYLFLRTCNNVIVKYLLKHIV